MNMHCEKFLEHFRAIAANFNWQYAGLSICTWKKGRYYDPLMALVQIAKGRYIERNRAQELRTHLLISEFNYNILVNVIYSPNYDDKYVVRLRQAMEEACELTDTFEPT